MNGTIWLTIAVAGLGASVIARGAVRGSRLHVASLAVSIAVAIAIFGYTVWQGDWWPWLAGTVLGGIGWTALDRAARRRGRQR